MRSSVHIYDTVNGHTLGHGSIDIGDKTADREQLAVAETTSRENISFAR